MSKKPTRKEWMKDMTMPVLPKDLPEYRTVDGIKLFDPKTHITKYVLPTSQKYLKEKRNENK